MTPAEESLKKLVGALIHDVRNQINGMVLELTDLRERWPEPRVTSETVALMRQAMEMADRLRGIRERLDPPLPRAQRFSLTDVWFTIAPQARLVEGMRAEDEIEIDSAQIKLAIAELVTNAVDASNGATLPQGRIEPGQLVITVENPVAAPPEKIETWGKLAGFTTKRRHLGLGCAYVNAVTKAHGGRCEWSYDEKSRSVRAEMRLPLVVA